MDRKYFNELVCILAESGIQSALLRDDNLTVLLDGQPACHVGASSQMYVAPGDLRTPEANELYHGTAPIAEMVREYMTATGKSPPLKAISLDEDFQLLAEFNGVVLVGRETEYGYKFVTWERGRDAGLYNGEYFLDGYTAAKTDFAVRAGMLDKQRLFTDEQLTEIYRCLRNTLDSEHQLTFDQEKLIGKTALQTEYAAPDVQEKVEQTKGITQEINM